MKTGSKKIKSILIGNIILLILAVILGAVSSSRAYPFDLLPMVLCGIAAILLNGIALLCGEKLPGILLDLLLLAAVVLSAFAMCRVIEGRITLVGYIYFSDLESNNPVSLSAMNWAWASVGAWLLALIGHFIVGFSRHLQD